MKLLLFSAFVLIFNALQAQTEVVSVNQLGTTGSFDQVYTRNCAVTKNGDWQTSRGNQPLGWNWRKVAPEFEISPEGKTVYLQSQNQSRRAFIYTIAGTVLALGALPVGMSGSPNNEFNARAATALSMSLGGLGLITAGLIGGNRSHQNRELAVWLRNRDAIATELSPSLQTDFKKIYNQQTIYLYNGDVGFGSKYVKNGQKYAGGLFGNRIKREFEGLEQSMMSFKRFQQNKKTGFAMYSIGLATAISSIFLASNGSNATTNNIAYFGGLAVSIIGSNVMTAANNDLRDAIYFRNRDVVRQSLTLR